MEPGGSVKGGVHTLRPGGTEEGWVVECLGVLAVTHPPVINGSLGESRFQL